MTNPNDGERRAEEALSEDAMKVSTSRKRSIPTNSVEPSAENSRKSSATITSNRKPRSTPTKKASSDDKITAVVLPSTTRISPKKTPFPVGPKYVLVLDNGSDTVKYGWSIDPQHVDNGINHNNKINQSARCQCMPNITARLVQQWTVLIGNDITTQVKNPNVSCTAVTRSCTERGMITNMGNQIQVWKHILDALHIHITPFTPTETSIAFGWNKITPKSNQPLRSHTTNDQPHTIPSNQCGVMIGLPPYTPRTIIEHIMSIWYEEFHFSHIGFCVSTVAAAIDRPIQSLLPLTRDKCDELDDTSAVVPIACVVDFGYSAIHIIPVYDKKVISCCTSGKGTIRRIPFGGKHMINMLKYYCSYRQWNLLDSEWIVRDVFEKTAFVSTSFIDDMKLAQKIPSFGKRPFDREYILPNYDTTFIGQVQIPESVQLEIERMQQQQNEEYHAIAVDEENDADEDEDEDDEDYNENDMIVDDGDDESNDVLDDEDDENESPEQIHQRLMKQRDDERRLREMEAEQHQILNVATERFAIPESLFRPSDVGLPTNWANLPQAIAQAIEACSPIYRPGLYRSIQLTGGLSRLPNLKDRLLIELRALVPCQYAVQITINDSPIDRAWDGISNITRHEPVDKWSVSREEWEVLCKRDAWKRLQMAKGGHFV